MRAQGFVHKTPLVNILKHEAKYVVSILLAFGVENEDYRPTGNICFGEGEMGCVPCPEMLQSDLANYYLE